MLSNKNHCDSKKQRNPKSSAAQKEAQSNKQCNQLDQKLSTTQKSSTPPNNIVNKNSKGTHQSDHIQSPPPIIILPTNYIQLTPPHHHISNQTFNCKFTPISTIFVTREIHFVPILSSSSSLIPLEMNHIMTFPPLHILPLIQSID